MRRVVTTLALSISLLAAAQLVAPRASAGAQWCDTDPAVVIITPKGAIVPVFVNNGAQGIEHLPAVLLASMTYTVVPAPGGTLVHLVVVVPNDLFAKGYTTRSVASTGPLGTGIVYAKAAGVSGKAMQLDFTLQVR
jgi:hypothetical protein